jgi:hypothetical protein
MPDNDFPRRNRLDLNEPVELAIYNAMQEVEKLPADERLTRAVTLLSEARNLVADFIDQPVTALNLFLQQHHAYAAPNNQDCWIIEYEGVPCFAQLVKVPFGIGKTLSIRAFNAAHDIGAGTGDRVLKNFDC